MLDLRGEPLETVVTRWPGAFPQYLVGHLERVQAIEERAARHRGLALAGAALHGVGVPACIGSGRRAAKNLLDGLALDTQSTR
jgi:oxygen-dependent protoporphyrinogen oxidase